MWCRQLKNFRSVLCTLCKNYGFQYISIHNIPLCSLYCHLSIIFAFMFKFPMTFINFSIIQGIHYQTRKPVGFMQSYPQCCPEACRWHMSSEGMWIMCRWCMSSRNVWMTSWTTSRWHMSSPSTLVRFHTSCVIWTSSAHYMHVICMLSTARFHTKKSFHLKSRELC